MASRQVDLSLTPESFRPVRPRAVARGKGARRAREMPGIAAAALPERYALLEDTLDQAVRDHIISPLPTREPESGHAYAHSRVATIRTRMYLLGYLEEDNHQEILGEALKGAIRSFQQEARMSDKDFVVDAWIGEQSWTALQELVSFEEPSNLQRWFIDGAPCPALQRAIQLRLFAFGLTGSKPHGSADSQAIAGGLQNFAALSGMLGYVKPLKPEACFETISRLFDQDELVHRLANATPSRNRATLEKTHAFILNITKAELWLHGYGQQVAPRGYSEEDALPSSHARPFTVRTNQPLYKALAKFWEEHDGVKARPVDVWGPDERIVGHVTRHFPEFFGAIDTIMQDETSTTAPESEEVFALLKEHPVDGANALQKVWNHIRNFASIVWDGIKRAWRWLVAMVKRGATYIRNLSRLAYNYILKSFEAVEAIVEGVAGSLSFFGDRVLQLPKHGLGIAASDRTLITRDGDFDFTSLVDRETTPEDTAKIAAYLDSKTALFALSCRFLVELLDIIFTTLKGIFSGWVLLLMALLKLYKSIRHWAPEFVKARLQERDTLVRQAAAAP